MKLPLVNFLSVLALVLAFPSCQNGNLLKPLAPLTSSVVTGALAYSESAPDEEIDLFLQLVDKMPLSDALREFEGDKKDAVLTLMFTDLINNYSYEGKEEWTRRFIIGLENYRAIAGRFPSGSSK